MSSGRCSTPGYAQTAAGGAPPAWNCGKSSTRCCTLRARAASGGCCRGSSRRGPACATTSTSGPGTAPWSKSISTWWSRRGSRPAGQRSPRPQSSIARAPRRPRPGASGATTEARKVRGRKRHILVDTAGLLLAVVVHAADVNDREGARWLLPVARRYWRTLQKLWADQGYTGALADWLRAEYGIELEIVNRAAEQIGFVVLPRRWVVERSL